MKIVILTIYGSSEVKKIISDNNRDALSNYAQDYIDSL